MLEGLSKGLKGFLRDPVSGGGKRRGKACFDVEWVGKRKEGGGLSCKGRGGRGKKGGVELGRRFITEPQRANKKARKKGRQPLVFLPKQAGGTGFRRTRIRVG